MGLLSSVGLQGRITLLIGLTLAVIGGMLIYLGVSAVDETEEAAQRELLASTARSMADHVDDVLTRTVGREEHLARMVANAWSQGEPELSTLLDAYPRFLFESELYLFRPQGALVWSMRPGASIPGGLFAEQLATDSLESLRSAVGPCTASATQNRSRACFATPVLLEDDEPAGILLAQVDLARPDLNLLSPEGLGRTVHVELVSADGLVLVANHAGAGDLSAHGEALGTPSSLSEAAHGNHTFAYAPISIAPGWGVIVEPRDGAALAVAGGPRQLLLVFGLAALALSLVVAWLGTRHLLRPLRALSTMATRMAGGDLNTSVTVARRDEVGTLAQALERLRFRLQAALADAQQAYAAERLKTTRGQLLQGLFARQEEERQRIAHELHEEAAQILAALALDLDLLEAELVSDEQTTGDRLTRSGALARALMRDVRRLAVDLRPPALNDLGLVPTLRAYAESRFSEKDIRIQFDASAMEKRPSPLLETALYRVMREAIDNIATHAEARNIRITLRRDGQLLTLIVEDDGKGFDPGEVLADADAVRGLGVLSMQERIAFLGGTFKIESTRGQGTRVQAQVPSGEDTN
jgi:signal transduction histidine kinase